MFKRIVLAATFVAALGAATFTTPGTAEARRYWRRPYTSYYYAQPRAYYRWGAPYRTYYYGPGYYSPNYGRPYGYYYGGPGGYYYGPRGGISFGFGF